MIDRCGCGGIILMTADTRLQWVSQCDKCLVRYAFTPIKQPRRMGRGWIYLLAWVGVGLLWYLGGLWAGGNW